jgi:DNA-binding NtrC family response regulator
MPKLNGEETLREIHQIAPKLKVILMSGYSEAEVSRHFKDQSLAGFVQKPFTPGELREKLQQVLE